MPTKQITGDKLTPADRSEVLRAYVHRYTLEHVPQWAKSERKDGKPYPLQFASDADWLANTWFAVRTDGRLDRRVRSCESRPTFPDNPELRRPYPHVATVNRMMRTAATMQTAQPDSFTRAYLEAIRFTDFGAGSEIPTDAEFAPETLASIAADCAKFQEQAAGLIDGCVRGSGEYCEAEQAGHDFWLTRNGHGAGFWDGDWPENGDTLTKIAKSFGEVWTYQGDNGLVYLTR